MTVTQTVPLDPATTQRSALPGLLLACILALTVFASIAPTLDWMPFCHGVEKLNIATALEIRRGSPWLIPTLEGEKRVRKPPLTAWITAAAIHPDTVQAMSSLDRATRERAYIDLAWQVRWPALLSACIALVVIYELGRTLLDAKTGLLALLVAATSLYFLRFTRQTITDMPLFLWVTVANLCLAKAIFNRQFRTALPAAGVALGVALMSKGPVAIVQSLVPIGVFLLWRACTPKSDPNCQLTIVNSQLSIEEPAKKSSLLLPLLLGLLLMLLIGCSWFLWIFWQMPDVRSLWFKEVARTDQVEKATSQWHDYLSLLPHLLPWTVFFLGGLLEALRALAGDRSWSDRITPSFSRPACGPCSPDRSRQGLVLALFLVIVPILIMSCFRDRKDRYLLPLLGPCAILIAASLRAFLALPRVRGFDKIAECLHWGILLLVAVGLPLLGATTWVPDLQTLDGHAWFSPTLAGCSIAAALLLLGLGILLQPRRRFAFIACTVLLMLAGQILFCFGHAQSRSGHAEMKPLADALWDQYPDALAYNLRGLDGKRKMAPMDLSIYRNRPTPILDTVDQIPSANQPQIYTALWEQGDPEPQPAPGWTFFHKTPRGRDDWWIAFLRLPAPSPSPSGRGPG